MKHMKRSTLFFLFILFAAATELPAQCVTPIASFPYQENFEINDGGWTIGGNAPDWAWGTPQKPVINGAASGNNCWVTGGLINSAYNNGENSWLQSPCFNFSSLVHPMISFFVIWEMERRFDGANLEYSINGGTSWNLVGISGSDPCTATNWYNNNAITYLGSQGWSGNIQPTNGSCQGGSGSNGWVTATHDLDFLAGQPQVIFRFRFAAGTTCNNYDGFAFDLFTITEKSSAPADFSFSCGSNNSINFSSNSPVCPLGYSWNFNDAGSGINNFSTLATPNHQFSAPGIYTVDLTITYPAAPAVVISHDVEVIGVSLDITTAILCNGKANGSITANTSGSLDPYQFIWSNGSTAAIITDLIAGVYTVTVSTPNSCPVDAGITLTEPAALSAGPIISNAICSSSNGSISITVAGGTAPYQYVWSNGETTAAIKGLAPSSYDLFLIDNNNCTLNLNNLVVGITNKTVPVSLGNNTFVCPGDTLLLDPGQFSSYLWQDNSILSTYTVSGAGQYSVTVTDIYGCKGSGTVKITADCSDIFFPAAFTPNGDSRNDGFGAYGNIASVSNYSFKVFDRWGKVIFATTDPSKKWNGSLKSERYNSGSFVWFASYTLNGKPGLLQKGIVTLLR